MARRQRMALGNAVLRRYELALTDWQGSAFLLRDRTGAAGMVQGLADLWPTAERIAGTPLDMLDPALLDALERQSLDQDAVERSLHAIHRLTRPARAAGSHGIGTTGAFTWEGAFAWKFDDRHRVCSRMEFS